MCSRPGVQGDVLAEPRSTRSEADEVSDQGPMMEEQLRAVTIGEPTRLTGPVELVDYGSEFGLSVRKTVR
jgi:hypothetical protein